jgi:endonuclease G, mitochondrial
MKMTVFSRVLLSAAFCMPTLLSHAAGFSQCPEHFFRSQVPRLLSAQPGKKRELCFDGFAVLHSGESKTPVYVAEHLTPERLASAHLERTNRFYEEARVPSSERARLEDYKKPGANNEHYDRGHMAPAADMSTANAMAQSFSLANMVPQAPQNNRGIWAKNVEKAVRHYVQRAGEVYVVTGPVFEAPVERVGDVWVPKYLFKLVFDPARGKSWAYWVENTNDARMGKPITYAELVRRTGIEFLPGE